ncbi:kinase-like domain-containing protein [Mycena pura]|uniref:Kinase-like domain-containing protein n=1 Tax=Mycena pura TaxID=153505 RepID=A0AAD6VJL5_9AGAR|nr:kinase-like domain-containing protein [Mycena pura]
MGNACYTARAARTGQVVLLRATALTPPVDRFAGQRLITELFLMRDMLAHANVVAFYDLYLVGKREVWLVQEYVADGAPLGELVAHNPGAFSEAQIARVCLEMCKGLAHLHSQLILHRDIRSDSIIVDPKGHVKITNFAYAVQLPDAAAKRRTMISTLTLPGPARSPYTVDKTHWTPPEVIRRHEYGPEVDVWALGITVREMLDGAPPYADTGAAPLRVLFLIRVNGAPPLRDPAPGAPGPSEALKGFLGACLEVDVERRATSAQLVEHEFLENACAPGELASLFEWRNDVPPPEDGQEGEGEGESVPDTGPAAGVPDRASGEVVASVPVLEIATDAAPAPAPAASESAAAPAPPAAGSQTVSSAVEVEPLARVSEADVPLTTDDPAISRTPDPQAVAGVSEAADAIAAGTDGPAGTVCVSESPLAVGSSA